MTPLRCTSLQAACFWKCATRSLPAAFFIRLYRAYDAALKSLAESYDEEHGGFTRAPKFPRLAILNFLFRVYGHRKEGLELNEKATKAMDMALVTLTKMARGGIYDHIGSSFVFFASLFASRALVITRHHRQMEASTDTASLPTGWSRSAWLLLVSSLWLVCLPAPC